jgi:DNA-binding transcriptional MerR regulator
MKLHQLAEVTSTPVSTVKYYLRAGLLPPGEKLNATTAAYGRRHVERLELIGALRQVVGLGLSQVRQVVEAVETLDPIRMMGRIQTIVLDLPVPAETPPEPAETAGRLTAQEVMDAMGWQSGSPESIAALDRQLDTMARWGLAPSLEGALVYARAADSVAAHELTRDSPWAAPSEGQPPSKERIATYTAVGIHAYSQLLLRLHSVAQGSHARGLGSSL